MRMSKFLACQHIDKSIRQSSASGAVFPALAENVLSEGGIVYGAAFSADFKSVEHVKAENLEALNRLKGPKYIQSNLNGIPQDVKRNLDDGRNVLFTGTPCQIAGLKSYLKCEYDNLFCMDIICHGVADKKIYLYYLSYLERRFSSKLTFVSFRDKTKSWRQSDVILRFENGNKLIERGMNNSFMRGFISNLFIRESCTRCRFKGFTSGSDLTIGDFWGSSEIADYAKDDTGVSVVAIHTPKGMALFDQAKHRLFNIKELTEKEAFIFNESYRDCAKLHTKKAEFYARYENDDFDSLVDELLFVIKRKDNILKRITITLKNIIRRNALS